MVALAAVATALTGAAPASAAGGGAVQLSIDGVHYGAAFPSESLFGDPVLVPQSSVDGAFWVRNASAQTGYLRIALSTAQVSDPDLASAMSVQTSTAGWPGTPVAVGAASPCYVLLQGPVLGAGAAVKIDARLALADLTGSAGQDGLAVFDILVTLSGAGTGAIPPTECPAPDEDGGGTLTPPTTPNGGTPGTVTTGGGTGGTHTVTFPGVGSGGGGGETVVVEPPVVEQPTTPDLGPVVQELVANTARLLQELDVMWWLVAAAIGALLLIWRRSRMDEDEDAASPRTGTSRPASATGEDGRR